mmetsp:Transcript_37669/g.117385  ORF Transcript_37669/g.117385 Transcript_37669/m.117385 type:complete len:748 (-) Transcript_37669:178-2421(-)
MDCAPQEVPGLYNLRDVHSVIERLRTQAENESLGSSFARLPSIWHRRAGADPQAWVEETSQPQRSRSAGPASRRAASRPEPRTLRRTVSCCSREGYSLYDPVECKLSNCEGRLHAASGLLRQRMASASSAGAYGRIQGSQVFRAAFEVALRKGQIFLTVASLVEAVVAAGIDSLPDAIGVVRTAWKSGDFRTYFEPPQVFEPDFFSGNLEKSEVWNAVMALCKVYASPVCEHLSWPLLQAVLQCLRRQHIRPSLGLILEVCHNAFGLACDEWDVLAAVCLAPREACHIKVVPWPTSSVVALDTSALLASTLVVLRQPEGEEDVKVFPPYAPGLEEAVEAEIVSDDNVVQDVVTWLQDAHATARANSTELTIPMILVFVSLQQASASRLSGGAVLWLWEKICAAAEQNDGESDKGTSDSGSDAPAAGLESREASAEEEMMPLEAFISCFHEDLRCDRPLFLSQLNNLYRMRSGGHDIKYRNHGNIRMGEFLLGVPGVELVGSGNLMAVQVSDHARLAEVAAQVTAGLQKRIAELRARGANTSRLEITYRLPQPVPKKILARVWDIFQSTADNEIPVNMFVSSYKERYPHDKLRFRSLGYQDLRGLMAHVPFIEKVGGRRHSKYVLKAGATPPEGCRLAAAPSHTGAAQRGAQASGALDASTPWTQLLDRFVASPEAPPQRRTGGTSAAMSQHWPAASSSSPSASRRPQGVQLSHMIGRLEKFLSGMSRPSSDSTGSPARPEARLEAFQ